MITEILSGGAEGTSGVLPGSSVFSVIVSLNIYVPNSNLADYMRRLAYLAFNIACNAEKRCRWYRINQT